MVLRRKAGRPVPRAETAPRDWAWIPSSGGPDVVFRAVFEADDADRLTAAVAAVPLPGFVTEGGTSTDEHAHERLREQARTGRPSNIWIFNEVRVSGPELVITRGYGGSADERCRTSETALLVDLASSPDLTWVRWEVRFEDAGEHLAPTAQGASREELQAYLRGEWPT